jgi:flagellar M-ring protein FliF
MPQPVAQAFQRVRDVIARFTIPQRTFAVIGVAAVVLGIFALSSWLSRPTFTPLFSGLSAADANAVVEQLRSASVPYELADGGATVLVPEEQVYDQRLAAAAAGLPSEGSEGYSLLDDMGVTTSEFQQSVTYKRAIEGELAATISSLDGVTAASVQLAIPEESVFVSEKVAPTASVFVETRSGTTLSPTQVEAIVHLTSAAVSGMEASNVTVVDQAGHTLSAAGLDVAGGADRQATEYEARVTASVQQMLDSVVGTGNSTVTVVADIDRSVSERTDETYTPADGAPPVSEQTRTETRSGSGGDAGVLGPDNIAVPDTSEGSTYESTEQTLNNTVNKTVETRTTPAGGITRQSVSVAVDSAAGATIGAAKLTELINAAAGIDDTRGDVVAVELVEFGRSDAAAAQAALEAAKEAADAERAAALLRAGLIAAGIAVPLIVAVVALVIRARRRSSPAAEFDRLFGERSDPLAVAAAAEAAALTALAPTVPLSIDAVEPAPPTPLELDPEPDPEPAQVSLQRRRAELDALTRADPKRTAELLSGLIDVGHRA